MKIEGRNLGFWETMKVLTHDLFAGSDSVVIDLHLKGILNVDMLKQALQICFNRHPLLHASVSQEHEFYQFNINQDFNLIPFSVIAQTHDGAWHEIIEREVQGRFKKEQYLWRIVLLKSDKTADDHLILSFHHAISDGTSLFAFLDEMLNYYAQLELGETPMPASLTLHDPQEKFLPRKISWDAFVKKSTRYQHVEKNGWKFHQQASMEERKTKFLVKKIPLELVEKLDMVCKKKEVSLNSLFNALALITKQQLDEKTYDGVLWSWANTRNICEPQVGNEHFGYFVNSVTSEHKGISSNTSIWELACDYHRQLKAALPRLDCFPADLNMSEIMTYYNMDKLFKADQFFYDFTLTYLSKVPLKEKYGSLKISNLNLAINMNSGIAGLVLAIFTFSEYVSFSCCYSEPLLDKGWVEKYMNKFEENIKNLAK